MLAQLYEQTLAVLKEMPATAHYRIATTKFTQERLDMVLQLKTDPDATYPSGAGPLDDLIGEARDELSLAEKTKQWAAWESVEEPAPAKQWKWP